MSLRNRTDLYKRAVKFAVSHSPTVPLTTTRFASLLTDFAEEVLGEDAVAKQEQADALRVRGMNHAKGGMKL